VIVVVFVETGRFGGVGLAWLIALWMRHDQTNNQSNQKQQ
jgi:hypothetical protein